MKFTIIKETDYTGTLWTVSVDECRYQSTDRELWGDNELIDEVLSKVFQKSVLTVRRHDDAVCIDVFERETSVPITGPMTTAGGLRDYFICCINAVKDVKPIRSSVSFEV